MEMAKILIEAATQSEMNMSEVELMDPEERAAAWEVLRKYSVGCTPVVAPVA